MNKSKMSKAAALCAVISMVSACGLNVNVPLEAATFESDVSTAQAGVDSSTLSSAEDSMTEGMSATELGEVMSTPVMELSENAFAEIDLNMVDLTGELIFAAKDKASGAWGFIDANGEWVLQPQYSAAYNFSDGYAVVVGADGKSSFIDCEGNKVLGDYDGIYNWGGFNGFNHGYARVYKDGVYQIIDTQGNVVNSAESELWSEGKSVGYALGGQSDDTYTSLRWYDYMGGNPTSRKYMTNTENVCAVYAYDRGNSRGISLIYKYTGEYIGDGYLSDDDTKYYVIDDENINEDTKYIIYDENSEQIAALSFPDIDNDSLKGMYLLDSVMVVEVDEASGSQFYVYTFDNKELYKFNAESIETIGSDMLLVKNNVGNYSIIGVDGTEYYPYTIGKEPLTTDDSSVEITIDGKEYVVMYNPNEEVVPGEKPAYGYFSVEDRKMVEMDEKYALYLQYRQSLDGKTVILERDGYVMSRDWLMGLLCDENGNEYMAQIDLSYDGWCEYSDSMNKSFCFEKNLYIVDTDGLHIGHIEY